MKIELQKNLFFPLLLLLAAGGCATGVKFTSEKDLGLLDRALWAAAVENPAVNLAAGEILTYEVSWMGIPVGHVIMENHGLETINGQEAYHLSFKTYSNDFLSNFFEVRDIAQTWISRTGGYSVRFEMEINEGHYSKHTVIDYDHENLTASYRRADKENYQPRVFPIPPDVQDVFSMIFWVRRQPLNVGEELTMDVNANDKNWVVAVEVKEKGVFDTGPLGRVCAFSLKPSATHNGEELKKGTGLVWMTADRRRIPLAFKAEAKLIGSINAVLSEVVLPPLQEYDLSVPAGDEDSLFKVCRPGIWLNGLTQAAARFGPAF